MTDTNGQSQHSIFLGLIDKKHLPLLLIGLTVIFCYGFEIFNFNLHIDGEIHTEHRYTLPGWLRQNRWALYLSNLLLPSWYLPVVPTLLGIVLYIVSFWLILRKLVGIDSLSAAAATSVAISIPTLSFMMVYPPTFYGIGLGFVLMAFIAMLIHKDGSWLVLYAGILGGFVIGTYQALIFPLLILILFVPLLSSGYKIYEKIAKGLITIAISVILYTIIGKFFQNLYDVKSVDYNNHYIDWDILTHNFTLKFNEALQSVIDVYALKKYLFGLQQPWFKILYIALAIASLITLLRSKVGQKGIRVLLWIGLNAVPLIAELLSIGQTPIRSQFYLPLLILLLFSLIDFSKISFFRYAFFALSCIVVVNNAAICNHLFHASEIAFEMDSNLAEEILHELKTTYKISDTKKYYLEVVGNKTWPNNGLKPKTEAFGASFFEWDEGNRYRIASFLTLRGIPIIGASEKRRVQLIPTAQKMPVWPNPGWITMQGNTVILKFGEYTYSQKTSLIENGARNFTK